MVAISKRVALIFLLAGILIGADLMLTTMMWFNVNLTPAQRSNGPVTDQAPTSRSILIEWTNNFPSGQDRFVPNLIVINQGDSVVLSFISNDSDAHTFTMILPTGLFQINASAPGLTNPLTNRNFTTPATGCFSDGQNVPCDTKGEIGSLVAIGAFTVREPGIYEFTCVYHPLMVGYLVVMPNSGFTPPKTLLRPFDYALRDNT